MVSEIPFTQMDAFSIKCFLSFFGISKSNRYDLSILLTLKTLPTLSKPGDYNPCHTHTEYVHGNYHLSCVGYLQIPKMISTTNAKEHNDFSGQTEFIEGSESMFNNNSYRVMPEVRAVSYTHLTLPTKA